MNLLYGISKQVRIKAIYPYLIPYDGNIFQLIGDQFNYLSLWNMHSPNYSIDVIYKLLWFLCHTRFNEYLGIHMEEITYSGSISLSLDNSRCNYILSSDLGSYN